MNSGMHRLRVLFHEWLQTTKDHRSLKSSVWRSQPLFTPLLYIPAPFFALKLAISWPHSKSAQFTDPAEKQPVTKKKY